MSFGALQLLAAPYSTSRWLGKLLGFFRPMVLCLTSSAASPTTPAFSRPPPCSTSLIPMGLNRLNPCRHLPLLLSLHHPIRCTTRASASVLGVPPSFTWRPGRW